MPEQWLPEASAQPGAPPHLEQSVRAGVLWKFAGQIGVQSTRFLTVLVLARLLDPADYGAAAIAVVLASFAPTLGDMGIASALVQTPNATRVVRSTAFWSSAAFGLALSGVCIVFAGSVGRFLGDPRIGTMVAVGALTFALYSLGATSQAMFMRSMNFRTLELRYLLCLAVSGAVAIIAATGGLGAWSLVIQQVVLVASFACTLWWRTEWRPTREFSRDAFRQLLRFAIRIAGGRFARLVELIALSLLIGRLVGVEGLGTWGFSLSTVILPLTVIAVPVAEVLFAAFSRLQGDRDRVAALWLSSIGLLAAAILPVLAGLMVTAPDVIPLAFGSQWEVAVPVVQILSVFVLIRALQSWNSVVLDAAGKPQVTLWTQLAALCAIPPAVALGSRWGVEGVAVCFVVGQLIAVEIPSFLFVRAELKLPAWSIVSRLAGVVAATAIAAVACAFARLTLSSVGVAMAGRAVAALVIGAVVYAGALWVFAPDIRRRILRLAREARDHARTKLAERAAI